MSNRSHFLDLPDDMDPLPPQVGQAALLFEPSPSYSPPVEETSAEGEYLIPQPTFKLTCFPRGTSVWPGTVAGTTETGTPPNGAIRT